MAERQIVYAGFWVRALASLVDMLLLELASWLLTMAVFGAIYWARILIAGRGSVGPDFDSSFSSLWLQIGETLIYMAIGAPYYALMTYRSGSTLGKKWLCVRVVDYETLGPVTLRQAWIRCVGLVISYLPFCTGYLMAAVHPERRALHDLMAGTVSIREKGRRKMKEASVFVALAALMTSLICSARPAQAVEVGEQVLVRGLTASALSTGAHVVPELGFAVPFSGIGGHDLTLAPRVGVIFDANEAHIAVGGESALWIGSWVAPSLGVDWVNAESWRVEGGFNLRLVRLGKNIAGALRAGPIYNSAGGWGAHLGLTLQIGGVDWLAVGLSSLTSGLGASRPL